jgi:acetoin:2,6-dichlorophenolindophenol oxidoreductase subunit alpha
MTGLQVSRDALVDAYRLMRTIRVFEDRVNAEMASGDIPGNTHLYAGQEASAVGVCMHLTERDHIASTHRGHGHSIAKGCDVSGMMAEIFGKATGICGGKGGSMHIADLSKGMLGANGIVGGSAPLACGAALTSQILRHDAVAVAFGGDGAINEGATAESMNLAAVWRLPVIFAVEDNGFGEATATAAVVAGEIVKRAEALGMPAARVDGVDFFAVHEAAGEAVARARRGDGPTLLHIEAPRYYGHFSGDPDTYRTTEEKLRMRRERDCLAHFRSRVVAARLITREAFDAIDGDVAAVIDRAVDAARAAPPPPRAALEADVYVRYL